MYKSTKIYLKLGEIHGNPTYGNRPFVVLCKRDTFERIVIINWKKSIENGQSARSSAL